MRPLGLRTADAVRQHRTCSHGPRHRRRRPARGIHAVATALTLLLVASCGGSPVPTPPVPTSPATAPAPSRPSTGDAVAPATPAGPATRPPGGTAAPSATGACTLPSLLSRAAQVLLVGIPGTIAAEGGADAVDAGVGGILLFGGNLVDADQVRDLVDDLQARAEIPLAIATDEEPGRIGRLARAGIIPSTPSARSLGEQPAAVVEARARRIGRAMADLGLTVDLAPVLDVTGAAGGGVIGDRSFGADPGVVARAGVAFARGLSGAGIAAVGKHFPGHGETTADSHTSLPVVTASLATLRRRALPPFDAAIAAGIPAIMLGHLQVDAIDPSRPTSLSSATVRLLRDQLGFDGLVMTDDLYMGGITERWDVPTAAVMALAAGVDMLILSTSAGVDEVTAAIVAAVEDGTLAGDRLDDAFLRVARFKGVRSWAACEP